VENVGFSPSAIIIIIILMVGLSTGVSGRWVGAWLMLSGRNLFYAVDNQSTKTMDLRKVRCMVLQMYQESDNNPRTNDKGPNIVVDTPNVTLYLRMWTSRETKVK
jgi:hypothetical protein